MTRKLCGDCGKDEFFLYNKINKMICCDCGAMDEL